MFGSRVETEVVGFFVFSYIKIVLRFRNGAGWEELLYKYVETLLRILF